MAYIKQPSDLGRAHDRSQLLLVRSSFQCQTLRTVALDHRSTWSICPGMQPPRNARQTRTQSHSSYASDCCGLAMPVATHLYPRHRGPLQIHSHCPGCVPTDSGDHRLGGHSATSFEAVVTRFEGGISPTIRVSYGEKTSQESGAYFPRAKQPGLEHSSPRIVVLAKGQLTGSDGPTKAARFASSSKHQVTLRQT